MGLNSIKEKFMNIICNGSERLDMLLGLYCWLKAEIELSRKPADPDLLKTLWR